MPERGPNGPEANDPNQISPETFRATYNVVKEIIDSNPHTMSSFVNRAGEPCEKGAVGAMAASYYVDDYTEDTFYELSFHTEAWPAYAMRTSPEDPAEVAWVRLRETGEPEQYSLKTGGRLVLQGRIPGQAKPIEIKDLSEDEASELKIKLESIANSLGEPKQ